MAESMAKIKTTHCQFRREVSRTLNIPYAIRDCIVVPNANIDCQIAETIGCSDRLYHWTVIVMRQGLNVDSKKPIRARLARIGGTVLLKASQKQSCSRQLEFAARSFDPTPVQTTIDPTRTLATGSRRISWAAYLCQPSSLIPKSLLTIGSPASIPIHMTVLVRA